ncbi:MAG: hypothetical protein ACYC6A_02495 [Armatimonadota bacterium]
MRESRHHQALSTTAFAGIILLLLMGNTCYAGRVWWDGSTDNADTPPGKLLSDNAGYWGECVLTGVDYRYETEPESPAEKRANAPGQSGRALVDGNPGTGAGISGGRMLTVVFDFNRICAFAEWDVITPTKQVAITIEMREAEDAAWRTVFTRESEACPDQQFHRVAFATPATGRFVRLTLGSAEITRLNEILAWGDAREDTPEQITPITQGQYPVGIAFPTVTGISKSAVSDRESFYWVQSLKPAHRKQAAVWSRVPTWSAISSSPILPTPESVNKPVHLVMARNETETVALALKNTLVDSPRNVEVKLSRFTASDGSAVPGISGKIGVFGVIGDRGFGNNLGPIFTADNLLGKSLLQKYLLNGNEIKDFPRLALAPSGGAVLWLSVTANGVKPGVYKAYLQAAGNEVITIKVDVLDVTLPMTFAHVKTYSANRTTMFPFEYADRSERDYAYALDSGISDWEHNALASKMAADRGMKLLYRFGFLIPVWNDPAPDYVGMIWQGKWAKEADFPKDAPESVARKVRHVVEKATALGLSYDEWYGTTGDEPGTGNIAAVAYMCRLIKETDPKVRIYVNPCYWAGFDDGGVADDATVSQGLRGQGNAADWYRKSVDISMPLMLLLRDRPQSLKEFSAPRMVNSYYYVSGHLGRSEEASEILMYRRMAWDSFALGFNGWAFYAWYGPRANPWNHFDQDGREPSDYQIVYPGPRGVIPTRHSEALREGWEDWRLLNLLRDKGLHSALQQALRSYKNGEPVEEIRLKALRAAAAARHNTGIR